MTKTNKISIDSVGQFFARPSDGGQHSSVEYATTEDGRIVRRERGGYADVEHYIGTIVDGDDAPFEPWNDSLPAVGAWEPCVIVDAD